ncbi:MAG: hypothetical protein AAF587_37585, partial [Bacteroidota bacterium]
KQVVSEQMMHIMEDDGTPYARELRTTGSQRPANRTPRDYQQAAEDFSDFVDSVDFPEFVGELLRSVFDANITVMKSQTDDYIRLMKEATTGLAKFIKQIDNTTTFAYLAENNSDQFNIMMEEDEEGNEKMALTNPQGDKVDMEDNEVKVKIMDAKIKMAQEHRAALREMILMGVTRLVVERGEIEAEVNFDFKGTRKIESKDRAVRTSERSNVTAKKRGLFGSIFSGPKQSQNTNRTTQFNVSSTKGTDEDTMKAKLRGYVNIHFKTDYFKLDNFADMYGQVPDDAKQAAQNAPGQLPGR